MRCAAHDAGGGAKHEEIARVTCSRLNPGLV
jgi:hypothetical protein